MIFIIIKKELTRNRFHNYVELVELFLKLDIKKYTDSKHQYSNYI